MSKKRKKKKRKKKKKKEEEEVTRNYHYGLIRIQFNTAVPCESWGGLYLP